MSIYEELTTITKTKRKENEDEQVFVRRLFDKVNALDDDLWATLSEDTQKWVNSVSDALVNKTPLPAVPSNGVDTGVGETKAAKPAKVKATKGKKETVPAADRAAAVAEAEAIEVEPTTSEITPAAAAKADGRGRPSKINGNAKITVLTDNPHRAGSIDHGRFENYKTGMTVDEAVAKGVRRQDINWHVAKGNISVE